MIYFAFPLKCKKLFKKINGASKLSYKSSNTRSPFLLSITGGRGGGRGGAHIKVTGELVFLLRGRDCELWSHLGWPGRKVNIFLHTGIV